MSSETDVPLRIGTTVDGRYQLRRLVGAGGLGHLFDALDLQTGSRVAFRVLRRAYCRDQATREELKRQIHLATALQHKNIAHVLDSGEVGDLIFVVADFVDGNSLRSLITKKRDVNARLSVRAGYNIIAHVCNALAEAHRTMIHGGLGPGSILITQAGRVRVTDFGLACALRPTSAALAALGDRDYIAPEMYADPRRLTPATDTFSIGCILYEILSGTVPANPALPLRQIDPSCAANVEELVARSMAKNPLQRFHDMNELKLAIHEALLPGDRAIDESEGLQTADPDTIGPHLGRDGQVDGQSAATVSGADPARARMHDLIARADGAEEERWRIVRDGMDYGPYTLNRLKQLLYSKEYSVDDVVVDQRTWDRMPIRENPHLRQLVQSLTHEQSHVEVRKALADDVERARRRRTLVIAVSAIAAAIAIVAVVVASFVARSNREQKTRAEREQVPQRLKIDVAWNPEPSDQAARRSRRQRRPTGKPGASRAQANEENVTYLGDATEAGGDELLSPAVVQRVMNENLGQLARCVATGQPPGRIDIDFGIRGSGEVTSVKVNQKTSGALYQCLDQKMRSIRFPKFNGTLTRASFYMTLR